MSLNTYDQPSKATERTHERWRRECKQGKWVEISLRDLRCKSNFITQNKNLRYKLTSNKNKVSHIDPKSPTGGLFCRLMKRIRHLSQQHFISRDAPLFEAVSVETAQEVARNCWKMSHKLKRWFWCYYLSPAFKTASKDSLVGVSLY